jgi:hypothetical protein
VLGLYVALKYPLVFLALLALAIGLAVWLLPKIWLGLKRLAAALRRLLENAA